VSETRPAALAGIDTDLGVLVAGLADNKYFLGRRYAEWCTSAPTLESAVAAAAMAQDEIGHARSLYPLLREIAGDSPEYEAETRTHFTNVSFLSHEFGGWPDFIATNLLFDSALSVVFEAARDASFRELAQRARRILEEEPLHWLHAEGWVRRLSVRSAPVRAALGRAVAGIAPETLQWLDIAAPGLVSDGVLSAGPDELRASLVARVNPVLEGAGLPPL